MVRFCPRSRKLSIVRRFFLLHSPTGSPPSPLLVPLFLFLQAFDKAITAIVPFVIQEQRFCATFFGFDRAVEEAVKKSEEAAEQAKRPDEKKPDPSSAHVRELRERLNTA